MTRLEPLQTAEQKVAAYKLKHVDRLRAPFILRCGAILIDYTLLISIVALITFLARLTGHGSRVVSDMVEVLGYVVVAVVAVTNLILLASWRGQTLGKWATGLRIERSNGKPLGLGRAFLRHVIGYPLSFLTLGFGFSLAALNTRGRTLHDLIAGTVVIREEHRREH
jgi:uncharacterized RDD family membrane protein YckC